MKTLSKSQKDAFKAEANEQLIFDISLYPTREALERDIETRAGTDMVENKKNGHRIVGTPETLKAFNLGETSVIYGIKIFID